MAKVGQGILSAFQVQHVGTPLSGRSGIIPFMHTTPMATLTPKQPPRIPLPPRIKLGRNGR